ncbi:unnamed protein product [Rotaria magnacalcarata]|uniref:Uncharacterized protein n=1 Tax=Rotaria magnacalcarata TaxID=392030 RepID=A0A814S822_9BILA|nr:unnamed protein product [Rotaria magnacalcarata]
MLIPPYSTFSNTNTNSNDDSVLIKRTPRVTRSSSCDTFSTAALNATTTPLQRAPPISSVPEPINYSSIKITLCAIGNAIQTLYSEQVENSSNVAYDAVPDQCNWNDAGIKLFENNENLYDPFNSSIELVHQPHISSRLNQSSTTISDRSPNITTNNSRNSSFEVLTNVISNFLTPSFSLPSKKRKFIIERPHGKSLTSMDAIYKINQNEKRSRRKPKTLTKPTFETFDVEEASNDTNANVMPMISCHSHVPYIPSQMPYSTQIHAPYGYNQSLKDFYSYSITHYMLSLQSRNSQWILC